MFNGSTKCRLGTETFAVSLTGVDLPVADEVKVLSMVLDRRLTFDRHTIDIGS